MPRKCSVGGCRSKFNGKLETIMRYDFLTCKMKLNTWKTVWNVVLEHSETTKNIDFLKGFETYRKKFEIWLFSLRQYSKLASHVPCKQCVKIGKSNRSFLWKDGLKAGVKPRSMLREKQVSLFLTLIKDFIWYILRFQLRFQFQKIFSWDEAGSENFMLQKTSSLINDSKNKKGDDVRHKYRFLSKQFSFLSTELSDRCNKPETVRDPLHLFLRSKNCYPAVRNVVTLSNPKMFRSYFGYFGWKWNV